MVMFIYNNNTSSQQRFIYFTDNYDDTTGFLEFGYGDNEIFLKYNGTIILDYFETLYSGSWYHFAVEKQGSTYRIYLNGQLRSTIAYNTTIDLSSKKFFIGQNSLKSYFDVVRVSKYPRYKGNNFVPLKTKSWIGNGQKYSCSNEYNFS